jgi:hypothetical protein
MSFISDIINEINDKEDIDIIKIVNKFESKLKKCFKLYDNKYGFEDFRMTEVDYVILYTIWKSLNTTGNLEIYLVIIYSYFKLEDFHFPIKVFNCNCNNLCDMIQKTNIIKIINNYIYL